MPALTTKEISRRLKAVPSWAKRPQKNGRSRLWDSQPASLLSIASLSERKSSILIRIPHGARKVFKGIMVRKEIERSSKRKGQPAPAQ